MPIVNIALSDLIFIEHPGNKRFRNLEGAVSGRLTILGYAGIRTRKHEWYAQCTCGNITKVNDSNFVYNKVSSCGCFKSETMIKRSTIHGHSKRGNISPELNSYNYMLARCNNVNHKNYKDYGGRGIKVLLTFEEFLDEVGVKPSRKHSIDRIDNNGHYKKGNIRWSTQSEQCRNKRNNNLLTYKSQTRTLTEWSEVLQMNYGKLYSRIFDSKMCVHHAFTLPPRALKPKDCPDCNL